MNRTFCIFAIVVLALIPLKVSAQEQAVTDTVPALKEATTTIPTDSINKTEVDPEQRIKDLDQELKEAKENIQELIEYLATVSSNFLYVPYDKFSIDEIAIPSYERVEKTKFYNADCKKLMECYKADIDSLCHIMADEFLAPRVGGDTPQSNNLRDKLKTALTSSDVYKRYKKYDDDSSTYLMKMMNRILNVLDKPNKDANIKLRAIRTELADLLREDGEPTTTYKLLMTENVIRKTLSDPQTTAEQKLNAIQNALGIKPRPKK